MATIAEYVPESLNLHARKPVQIAIEACDEMSFNPLTSLDNCSTVQFLIPSYPGRYIDTNNIFLKTHFQVVKSGGELYKIDHELDSTNIDFNTTPGENYLNSSSLNVDKLNHVEIVKSKPGLDAALLNCFRHLTQELIKITREKNNKLDDKK
jgi:hypothetical protein